MPSNNAIESTEIGSKEIGSKEIGSKEIGSKEIGSTAIRAKGIRKIGSKANAYGAESMPLNNRLKLTAPSGHAFCISAVVGMCGRGAKKRAPRPAA